jgi:hypothetical protein
MRSLLSLIGLLLLTVLIHEGSHFLAAVVMRAPIAAFTWLDLRYFAPVLVSSSAEQTFGTRLVSYAGGFVTGTVLLAVLALKREWFRQSLYRWLLGLYLAMFGMWQISQGVLEGAFHDMYIADAADILSLSQCVGYGAAVLGMLLYWVFMPGLMSLLIREKRA